ncbi:hypothetical protein L5515_003307 [Caenorhabditis briggsae]|uniref:Uncharacterized protein n=1 Tax=Caenorhabditis briggsae TaxID=6238 RepID=A0AAE9EIW0_CAEBR|nr:hypothetical protein L5515_003307 [Caenorhabditis briggsae]
MLFKYLCSLLKENQEPLYHVDTGAVNDIWYFIQNHQVNSEDIRPLNILHHSFLEEMNSDDFSLSPARYKFLMIKVIVKKNTFEIKLLGVIQEDLEQENNLDTTIGPQSAHSPEPHSRENVPLHNLTIDDAPESLKLQDVVDNLQVEAKKLLNLIDGVLPPMNLNKSQLLVALRSGTEQFLADLFEKSQNLVEFDGRNRLEPSDMQNALEED